MITSHRYAIGLLSPFMAASCCLLSWAADVPAPFDIAPFALPNTPGNELWFEEPRDIVRLEIEFEGKAPASAEVYYRRHYWPETKIEERSLGDPMPFGWIPQDDLFNGEWHPASVHAECTSHTLVITFKPLTTEFPDEHAYDVAFRRTVAVRVGVPAPEAIKRIRAYTVSQPRSSALRVRLNAGTKTPSSAIRVSGYNATTGAVEAGPGTTRTDAGVQIQKSEEASFTFLVEHMQPAHAYCWDDGHITFVLDNDAFTISLSSLDVQGPIWSREYGVYVTRADDLTTFEQYLERNKESRTLNERLAQHPEQTYMGAYRGQPRPHAVPYFVGVGLARQRFRVEPNGEIWVYPRNIEWVPGRDTGRTHMAGITHFRFGPEDWMLVSRHTDPEPANVMNLSVRQGGLVVDQKVFAVPLLTTMRGGAWASDDPMVAMARFTFRNEDAEPVAVELPLRIDQEDNEHAQVPPNPLRIDSRSSTTHFVYGPEGDSPDLHYLRCAIDTSMSVESAPAGIVVRHELQPGESCEAVVKIPHIALESEEELSALASIHYAKAYVDNTQYWRAIAEPASKLNTPEPRLNALYASHFSHVQVTDFEMPDDRGVINTSVGTSVYGNFSNESCMIVHELDERGLHDQARRRLDLWVKYQGTKPQPGNFTDYDGMYFGAGGFEHGNYNQHHAWVLWALCEHLAFTGDQAWFQSVADSVIAGADWVFRQRKNTMTDLPHSRGWERGFLPAGSLEDVEDYHYWLSTNALTWRAVDSAARALESMGHADAGRVRAEADAYRADLIAGFETMRQHTPMVRLRDGRWVPNYPSRLYHRGRQVGWIRETLEGSVYLLLSGLYESEGKEAQWILDDFQDNRYTGPPTSYFIPDFENTWFNRAGISMQPNLLAGLMPHLYRDEPEIYIWMFYNAWCACYREEVNAMVEHPMPWLGFSNRVVFKPSDEANACAWLRYMLVYTRGDLLHFGRAVPRAWFAQQEPFSLQDAATPFGKVGIEYSASADAGTITAAVSLDLRSDPGTVLVRFRHPSSAPMQSVLVNGQPHNEFDAERGDVDITGMRGDITIEARY